jgi:hypothetical protein
MDSGFFFLGKEKDHPSSEGGVRGVNGGNREAGVVQCVV